MPPTGLGSARRIIDRKERALTLRFLNLAAIDLTGPRKSEVVMIRKSLAGGFQMPAVTLAELSANPIPKAVPGNAVRDQLARILNSNRTLDGDGDSLKENLVGAPFFDPLRRDTRFSKLLKERHPP